MVTTALWGCRAELASGAADSTTFRLEDERRSEVHGMFTPGSTTEGHRHARSSRVPDRGTSSLGIELAT